MKLADMIPVNVLTIPMVETLFKQFGVDVVLFKNNIETLTILLDSIKKQEKYDTVGDILRDEELVQDILALLSKINVGKDAEPQSVLSITNSTVMKCPSCDHYFSIKNLKAQKD